MVALVQYSWKTAKEFLSYPHYLIIIVGIYSVFQKRKNNWWIACSCPENIGLNITSKINMKEFGFSFYKLAALPRIKWYISYFKRIKTPEDIFLKIQRKHGSQSESMNTNYVDDVKSHAQVHGMTINLFYSCYGNCELWRLHDFRVFTNTRHIKRHIIS